MLSKSRLWLVSIALAVCLGSAAVLGLPGFLGDAAALGLLAAHVLAFGLALAAGWPALRGRLRPVTAVLAAGCLGLAAAAGSGLSARAVVYTHALLGLAATGALAWSLTASRTDRARRCCAWALGGVGALLVGGYMAAEAARTAWRRPEYDSRACYRFLTATTQQQSGEPHFPSALRVQGRLSGDCSRCHSDVVVTDGKRVRHTNAAASAAYRRTFADFVSRRGEDAGRWCQGCHAPQLLAGPQPGAGGGSSNPWCATCHQATDVHAQYGSAALVLRGEREESSPLLKAVSTYLQSRRHADRNLAPDLHRSSEFCGGCHRKNWNLPQNEYHWMPGPDELGQWLVSPYAPAALFAAGERVDRMGCLGCHDAHGPDPPPEAGKEPLALDLFVRRGPGFRTVEAASGASLRPGEAARLDVVVRNRGIGHDFPTGMPDLREAWIEVRGFDAAGREVARHGVVEGGAPLREAHRYLLVGLDRGGKPILHGDLDRMVTVAEWRRIPAGGADLARYALTVPATGLARVQIRLLRRRRPDFSRWVGKPVQQEPEVLAKLDALLSSTEAVREEEVIRWRHYGSALAAVKSYPESLQALQRSLTLRPDDPETLLSLGRVYLDEGDLLAAQEQFRRAQAGDPERGRGWEGAVLRRMGQPDRATALLEPLVRRYPRDLRLRFELGSTYLAALRNEEAAREFTAMLDVDPLDVSAHYNLMLAYQRLNRLTDARREETIYHLLRQETRRSSDASASPEARPLHVHMLEAAR